MKRLASAIALPLAVLATVVMASCGEDSPTGPPSPSSVELTAPKLTLAALGETVQLQAEAKDGGENTISGMSFTWESSDTTVLSVSDAGLATAVANGSARVTATTNGVSSGLVLTVQQSATSVELTAPELTLAAVGEMLQLEAEAEDANGNAISEVSFTWESSDTTVLSVSDAGLATAVASGSAEVTATTDGVSSELVLTVQQSAPQLAAAAFVNWDGGGGNFNWNDPLNWDTDALPGPTDGVIIDVVGDITVTHSSGTTSIYSLSSEEALVLSGGSFAISAASTVNSTLTLSGATLTGAGELTVAGLLTWSGGTMSGTGKTIADGGMLMSGPGSVVLDGRTIDNSGTAIWDPPIFFAGNGAVFNNTGIIDIIGDAGGQAFITTVSTLNNTGTLRKSGGAGTATLWLSVNNTGGGTVEVQSGTLRFANGGTTDSPLDVLASAGLEFSGGTFSLEAGVDMTVPGTVSITGGTLTGAGDRTVEGLLTWSGGTMSGTGKTIADGGMLMSGPGSVVLDGRTIDNSGTAIWDPPIFFAGNGAVFNNTGIIDIIGDAGGQAFITTVSTLNNTGTLRKSGGAGTATLWLSVNNTGGGTVEVQSGTLRFANGGTTDSPLDVLASAGLEFSGGTFSLEAGVDMTVPGTVSITGGTLTGAGNLTVEGLLTWSGGTMSGTGKTIADGGMLMSGPGSVVLDGRTIDNSGTAIWDPPIFFAGNGAVFNNTGFLPRNLTEAVKPYRYA